MDLDKIQCGDLTIAQNKEEHIISIIHGPEHLATILTTEEMKQLQAWLNAKFEVQYTGEVVVQEITHLVPIPYFNEGLKRCLAAAEVFLPCACEYLGVQQKSLFQKNPMIKTRLISGARAILSYILYEQGNLSYPNIGDVLNVDHVTAMNGHKRIDKKLNTNQTVIVRSDNADATHAIPMGRVVCHLQEMLKRKYDEVKNEADTTNDSGNTDQ